MVNLVNFLGWQWWYDRRVKDLYGEEKVHEHLINLHTVQSNALPLGREDALGYLLS